MPENQRHTPTWGTWEELLLACAVKRHGFNNWDSVAMEVQSRTSLPPLLVSSLICQQKYHDLHRRFTPDENLPPHPPSDDHHHHRHQQQQEEYLPSNNNRLPLLNNSSSGDKVVNIPWLEELRQLRVAELKQEVHRYDVSILSLQLKVKKLEEERENSLQDNHHKDQGREGPDLDRRISEFHQPDIPAQSQPQKLSPEESDRSVNESNSTCSERKPGEGTQGPLVRLETEARTVLSGSNSKQVAGEESYEVGDSVTQLSSEVQSSASLGRKRSGKEVAGGDDDDDGIKRVSVKSEPLVGFLDMIRAHQHASLFECRLQSQETDEYKSLVRQHLDLETIQTKLEQCSYNTSSNLSFYRDLLLLFNNAVVFFPNSSIESQTAHQLRSFVSNEMRKETQKSDSAPASLSLPAEPKNELQISDSLLARQKSSAPIIVCRKRSSLSAKPSSSSSGPKIEQQQQQQRSNDSKPANDLKQPVVEPDLVEAKSKEKPVTGVRSSRRNIKNLKKGTSSTPNKKQNESPGTKAGAIEKAQTPKNDKKKTEASAALEKKKSAADFLKRIKKNSPVEASKKNNSRGGGGEKKTENSSRKGQKGKERVGRRNGETKQVKEESNPSTTKKSTGRQLKKGSEGSRGSRKRGREGSGTDQAATRPRKRSKR